MPRVIRMFHGGDDHLMSSIMKVFEDHGFRPIGAHEVAPEILIPEVRSAASSRARTIKATLRSASLCWAQSGNSMWVKPRLSPASHVLAVEAAEGTDEMLAQVAELRRKGRIRSSGGVLVKASKPGQDRRIDLPTIGPKTVAGAAQAGLAGIAVVAGDAIMAEPDRVRQAADRERIFIVGIGQDAGEPWSKGE